MKANELMIGDWVICYHPTCKPKQIQVNAGLLNGLERQDLGLQTEESPLFRIVEPIPLTAEILEKNGEFGKTVIAETIYRLGGDDYCVRKIGERYSFIRCAEYGASWWLFDICYVHELQHALRLCGIEKNIVL